MGYHLEYLYVTLRRNSAHRVTEIVTIFGRILYVFTANSVRFCTVVFDGPAPPGTEISTKYTGIRHMRPITSVPSMHCFPAQIIGDFFTHKKRILQGQHWTPVVTNKSSGICKEFFT